MNQTWPPSWRGVRALLTSAAAGILIGSPAISTAVTISDTADLLGGASGVIASDPSHSD